MDTCILCKSNKKDDVQYGEYLKNHNFGVHTFCLYLSSGLPQNGADDEGFLGFMPADIKREAFRVSPLKCVFCHKKHANIGCCESKCRGTFHLICGINNSCENRFCHDFSSYCPKHIHRVKERPSAKETCLICFDSLWTNTKHFNAINMIQTPCCRNGWFHKLCLQKFAKTSGYFFKCPLCNDAKEFRAKLPARGIYIPNQDAAWELEPNAFAELLERPSECSALQCKYRRGRKSENPDNPFILCSTCGSTAMHKQCLPNKGNRFHCADCTIAREEADSGRESVNSHGNDEEIDVCNVSDKEDLGIIQTLIDNTNNIETEKSKDKARDSGLTADQEENHRQMSEGKVGRSEETSRQDEKPGHSKKYKTKLYKKPLRIISDSSSEEEEEEKVPIKQSLLHNRHLTSKDEVIVTKPGYKRTFISDCDTDILENRPSSSKNCKKSNLLDKDSDDDDVADNELNNKSVNISLDSSEDNSDDPIEKFEEIMEKRRNKSCIALRTRRRSHDMAINSLPVKESSTNQLNNIETTTNEQCFKKPLNVKTTKQPENMPANSKTCKEAIQKPKEADKKSKSSRFKPLKDETNTKASNELDISCIAKRTRRKSMGSCKSSKTIKNKENRTEEDAKSVANVSCIAVRTRRRTICAQSAKEHFQLSQIYEKIQDSSTKESRPICAQSAKEHFQMSQVYEKIQDSSTEESDNELENILEEDEKENTASDSEKEEDVIINDYKFLETNKKMDKFVDISCIAKRTRRRKSLTTKLQAIDDTGDSTCSSTRSSSTSSTLTSPSHIFQSTTRKRKSSANRLQLIDDTDDEEETASSRSSFSSTTTSSSDSLKPVKLNKRCSKRTLSSSFEESSSTSPSSSYESHCTSKTKISPSYLCEKFPQQNYAAFFNRRLVSSKFATNTAHNYYDNNQYHPHSNNRRRF